MKHRIAHLLLPLFFLSNLTLFAQSPEFGLASFYSDDFQGRKTAYDVIYKKEELTCAHKKHPFGTTLKVTRLDNKKSVTVKVIDKAITILGVGVNNDFSVALGLEHVPFSLEFTAKLAEIVDLTITDDPERVVVVRDGLVTTGEVNNGKSLHSQRNAFSDVHALVVRTTMKCHRAHPLDDRSSWCWLTIQWNDAVDTTHSFLSLV